ncbi:MAG TPA: hypothetical protein VK509_20670, partial [Polyangiales bacterium]|nr:hypothetical protein [Polyangiales bacterium]
MDRDVLERALQDAHVPTLMAALVHLTGDLSLVREAGTLTFGYLGDYQGKLSPELQARVRSAALEVLGGSAGSKPAPLPIPVVRELMTFVGGGQPVSDDYLPFLLEELGIQPDAAPRPTAPQPIAA